MDWEQFTPSQNWDALCEYASLSGRCATLSVEEPDGTVKLIMRTADPRVNPKAVWPSESSTRFRLTLVHTMSQHLTTLTESSQES